jgi:hypothetical protein
MQGNDILVIVPPDLNANFDKQIVENNSYCFENFQVLKNEDQFKVSQNQYKLRFNGSTLLYDVNVHQIQDATTKFKDFVEILSGKWREDVLYGNITVEPVSLIFIVLMTIITFLPYNAFHFYMLS